ncbi:unnamed protein product [Choristocarpus tenellus]
MDRLRYCAFNVDVLPAILGVLCLNPQHYKGFATLVDTAVDQASAMSRLDRRSFAHVVTSSVSIENLENLHPTDLRFSDIVPLLTVAKGLTADLDFAIAEIRFLKTKWRTHASDKPQQSLTSTFPEPHDPRTVCDFKGCNVRSRRGHSTEDCWANPEGNNYHPSQKGRESTCRRDRFSQNIEKSLDCLVSALTACLASSILPAQPSSNDDQDHPELGGKRTRTGE